MESETVKEAYQLRSGAAILPEQDKEFHRLLGELLPKIPARFILLVDVAGQVITAKGDHEQVNLIMLGSLVAGDLAASQEIARLTGEYQDYQIILREGQHSHTFISEAGNYLVLLVQVDNDVPLGWARMLIQQTVKQLAEIMATAVPVMETETFKLELDDEDEDDLSDLFSDALDDMWVE
jgi:predicted regulator of Ras-like GTPase activity (Roadblock/LC7/MglB family)